MFKFIKKTSFTCDVSYKKKFKYLSGYTKADHKKHVQHTFLAENAFKKALSTNV